MPLGERRDPDAEVAQPRGPAGPARWRAGDPAGAHPLRRPDHPAGRRAARARCAPRQPRTEPITCRSSRGRVRDAGEVGRPGSGWSRRRSARSPGRSGRGSIHRRRRSPTRTRGAAARAAGSPARAAASPASVLGGMNSKENDRPPAASRSRMASVPGFGGHDAMGPGSYPGADHASPHPTRAVAAPRARPAAKYPTDVDRARPACEDRTETARRASRRLPRQQGASWRDQPGPLPSSTRSRTCSPAASGCARVLLLGLARRAAARPCRGVLGRRGPRAPPRQRAGARRRDGRLRHQAGPAVGAPRFAARHAARLARLGGRLRRRGSDPHR